MHEEQLSSVLEGHLRDFGFLVGSLISAKLTIKRHLMNVYVLMVVWGSREPSLESKKTP